MSALASDFSPLVCIHGFSGSWRNWVPIVPELERHHRVHVARLAGHARGPALPDGVPITVTALADQLERDFDAAGIGQAHLVGNSLGGWLSLELAARGRALSVVALSPALGWQASVAHLRRLKLKLVGGRKVLAAIAPYAETALKHRRLRQALFNGAIAHSERLTITELAAFGRDNLRCSIYFELMASFLTTEAQLGNIACPVHIAWSELDALIPRDPYGVRFPTLVPQAQFSTIAGVGHVPMYDDPPLVAATITEFTRKVDADTASRVEVHVPDHQTLVGPIAH
ncbi:MAG: alpha/beta fold hydrolase [Actinomycetia bacterium]|nr:alpha/beta fold hydrolase [Actinomycetes bacterium]